MLDEQTVERTQSVFRSFPVISGHEKSLHKGIGKNNQYREAVFRQRSDVISTKKRICKRGKH
jgi:hypothetical protein